MWGNVVRVASPRWNTLLRRAEQHQLYMELTPLLFYFGAMVLRQVKCECSMETIRHVQLFMGNLSKGAVNDSKLYTPTLSNYWMLQGVVFSLQQNCSRSTLNCFAEEMIVLVQETETNTELPIRLKKLIRHLNDKMTSCPQCEVYKEEKAATFLSTLLTILQSMCSKT
ncbi:interleukin 15, like isoform X1 [Silurus meridionalis]|uniref:interleukin 15, like isoform X1 n=1 Tax=Silurus meridionalis TaxID=175797 RepID=UPI001EEC07DA|nr:interleukin 15, like isoform X1 [Silurus meridionalis]